MDWLTEQKQRVIQALSEAYPEALDEPSTGNSVDKSADETTSRVRELIEDLRREDMPQGILADATKLVREAAVVVNSPPAGSTPPIQPSWASNKQLVRAFLEATGASLPDEAWLKRMEQIKARVGKIRVNMAHGTAFLVSEDLVMTNYHVVRLVLSGVVHSAAVRIDFEDRETGGVSTYRLAQDWRVAASPPSPSDWDPDPGARDPTMKELDCALLRVEGAPGQARGAIEIPAQRADLREAAPLHIVQYPGWAPMTVALKENAILGVNKHRTRVRYLTYTDEGASGAPCFDKDWNLVALHRGSDPDLSRRATHNVGIPIDTIRARLPTNARQALGW